MTRFPYMKNKDIFVDTFRISDINYRIGFELKRIRILDLNI